MAHRKETGHSLGYLGKISREGRRGQGTCSSMNLAPEGLSGWQEAQNHHPSWPCFPLPQPTHTPFHPLPATLQLVLSKGHKKPSIGKITQPHNSSQHSGSKAPFLASWFDPQEQTEPRERPQVATSTFFEYLKGRRHRPRPPRAGKGCFTAGQHPLSPLLK